MKKQTWGWPLGLLFLGLVVLPALVGAGSEYLAYADDAPGFTPLSEAQRAQQRLEQERQTPHVGTDEHSSAVWAERYYKKLNDDMRTGRRAPTKSGKYEREEPASTVKFGEGNTYHAPVYLPPAGDTGETTEPEPGHVPQDAVPVEPSTEPNWWWPFPSGGENTKPSTSVPEPGSLSLLVAGIAGIVLARKRRN